MNFRFSNYAADELRKCGRAFVEVFADARSGTADTTEAVKQFFARSAAPDVSVLGCNGRTALMLDQCHVSYPASTSEQSRLGYWDSILSGPVRMRLAMESEVGKYGNMAESIVRVLDDAQKVAFVNADAKAIVFRTTRSGECADFVRRLELLRKRAEDASPWLWIDLPWSASTSSGPTFGVFVD